ncbi:C-C chemokine receptor type 3-like isoform X2 [Genypterus blacodes]
MFLFSLFSNGLVLLIIYRFEKLTTVTNIFLLNLVVSCLIFSCSLPFWAVYQQLGEWIFGKFLCKFVGSAYFLGSYTSVLFLTLLTFDRHLAVVYSLAAFRMRSKSYAVASCVCVWLVSILACMKPIMLYTTFTYLDSAVYCEEFTLSTAYFNSINLSVLRSADFYIQIFLFFLFPLVVIIYCYIRIAITVLLSKIVSKFKTVRLICVIVLLFFVCWAPYNIVLLIHRGGMATCQERQTMAQVLQITRSFAYIYFCICPLFYTFVGKKFQNHFGQLLVKRFPQISKFISVSQTSRSTTKYTPN